MSEKYAGSEWVRAHIRVRKKLDEWMSPLGRDVADILGQVFRGIYHLSDEVDKTDWSRDDRIRFVLSPAGGGFATTDGADFTELVILCHDRAIRMAIQPVNMRFIALSFTRRGRFPGHFSWDHPTIEQAVERVHQQIGLGVVQANDDTYQELIARDMRGDDAD